MSASPKMATLLALGTAILTSLAVVSCAPSEDDEAKETTSTERLGRHGPVTQLSPVIMSALSSPQPVRGTDGLFHLVYELQLINVSPAPAHIERLEVLDAESDRAVVTFAGEDVAGEDAAPNMTLTNNGSEPTDTLEPAQAGLVWFDVTFTERDEIPAVLEHQIVARNESTPDNEDPEPVTATAAAVNVDMRPPVKISPPFEGDLLVAGLGCCDQAIAHRRTLLPLDGSFYLAERFAIDWIRIDEQGREAVGDLDKNESYLVYGMEVLAGADAIVATVVDGMRENTAGQSPPNPSPATAAGNHVILDLGDGRYAMYAHLQPGSIRVKEGDRVRRGQVLGLAGNSGNSDTPHLHLHVMDNNSPLFANGLPFVIDSFNLEGQITSDLSQLEESGQGNFEGVADSGPREAELPLDFNIVSFAPRR